MINMIICDDEKILRNGLRALIEHSNLPIEVTGTAENGLQAWQMIRENKPFIALMDINMPGLSGLDVIEKAKQEGISTHFIIITGHDEFQYAKRACHLHVADYLLKPIDRDELMELLESILKRIRREQLAQRAMTPAQQTVEHKILHDIQERFMEQEFSLGELSEKFSLSQSYLTRLIKQETGKSFSELVTQLRLDLAVTLLVQYPDMKLVEIAERTGFASQHYFSRVFKEKIGLPPADYRQKMRDI